MRQKLVTLFLLLVGLNPYSHSQTYEIGGFLGFSNYMGDLQQTNFELITTNVALGVFTRINLNNSFSLKAHIYKGEISGSDANYQELKTIRERNLSFRSHIFELGLQAEVTFSQFGELQKRLAAPYVFVGISAYYFNPQAEYDGRWISLQPLGTEGQTLPNSNKSKYNRFQVAIPIGIGFNVNLNKKMILGFELGFRKTFTDYLDDTSSTYPDLEALRLENPVAAQLSYRTPELINSGTSNPTGTERGNPKGKDMYFFGGFTFSTLIE